MRLLIDGYNLLFASNVFVKNDTAPTLANTREALLDFLAENISAKLHRETTIVFDATQAPPGLPREMRHQEMQVLFSARKTTADELLEQLLEDERNVRNLLVISSDHRVQRAARQRGAAYKDSETWLREQALLRNQQKKEDDDRKPEQSSSEETAHWIEAFRKKKP